MGDLKINNPIGSAIDFGRDLIDKIWPDKTAQAAQRAQAEAHVLDLAQSRFQSTLQASVATDAAQSDINKIDAAAPGWIGLLKSGWRPAIGWVGAAALFMYYVPYCAAATVMWIIQCYHTHTLAPRPDLDIKDLLALITILLGASTQRMLERLKGVS
jgi:hypothetical protein